jgi:8-oxo-dGTP pyrophosphatase MutT (NUDIX family)
MKKRKPAEAASQEAYEEAGLIGQIVGKRPFGSFHYGKLVGKEAILCEVRVFLFRVEQQLDDWPETRERESKWFEAREAAGLVDEGRLAELIDRFFRFHIRFPTFSGF